MALCLVSCVFGGEVGVSKKVAMIGGGPQQGGGALLGGHPCLFVVNSVVTKLLATKLLLLGCKATRDSARESNISKVLFCEEKASIFYKETDTSIEMSWNK